MSNENAPLRTIGGRTPGPGEQVGRPFVKGDPRMKPGKKPGTLNSTTRQAMELLQAKALEIAENLTRIATNEFVDEKPCLMCGRGIPRDESVQVKAIIAALDRCGMGPQSKLQITTTDDTSWIRELSDEQLETLQGWIMDARARQATLIVSATEEPLGASPEPANPPAAVQLQLTSGSPQDGPLPPAADPSSQT